MHLSDCLASTEHSPGATQLNDAAKRLYSQPAEQHFIVHQKVCVREREREPTGVLPRRG
jgi:hypothetical protein